jgi:hypothetical protein
LQQVLQDIQQRLQSRDTKSASDLQLHDLEAEAGQVISFKERNGVVDATGQVANVNASEGVRFPGVAAEGEELREPSG